MYGRRYDGKELRFEPSGGLIHASLVMQDKETDSYWSIMTGRSLAGEFEGTRLEELPVGVKARWEDWVAEHPDTLVLSVDGTEHEPVDPYENYFGSESSYRGMRAADDRLATKAPIYAFRLGGRAYAVPFERFEGGAAFAVGDRTVFLYRPGGAALYRSTVAFVAPGAGAFELRDGVWGGPGGAGFDAASGTFDEAGEGSPAGIRRLDGFDTFWFNWSMTHPSAVVLGGDGP